MSRKLMALVAAAALAAPVTAHANTNADGAVRQTKATAATCAFGHARACPARRTKLFQFWGKVAEASRRHEQRRARAAGIGTPARSARSCASARRHRRPRLTGTTKFVKIDFTGGAARSARPTAQVVEDNPRATLYVDARMWPNSVWNDDEPILRAVRVVVDLSDLPAPTAGQGLTVSYFANKDLTGTPSATGIDQTVDFDWGSGGPALLAGKTDTFGVKWTGSIVVPVDGAYTFRTTSDDGVRLRRRRPGGQRLDGARRHQQRRTVTLAAGSHSIEYRYFENTGRLAQLSWLTPARPATWSSPRPRCAPPSRPRGARTRRLRLTPPGRGRREARSPAGRLLREPARRAFAPLSARGAAAAAGTCNCTLRRQDPEPATGVRALPSAPHGRDGLDEPVQERACTSTWRAPSSASSSSST